MNARDLIKKRIAIVAEEVEANDTQRVFLLRVYAELCDIDAELAGLEGEPPRSEIEINPGRSLEEIRARHFSEK